METTENTFIWWALYVVVMGAINTWRGRGYVDNSRYYAVALWALVSGVAAYSLGAQGWEHSILLGLIVGAGCFLWLLKPWGQGFAAFTGVWEPRPNTVHWIENICLNVYPYPGSGLPDPKAYARGTLFMALRGLYIIPLFVVLALFQEHPGYALYGLVGLMQGVAYGAMRWVTPCQRGHWNCQAAGGEFFTMACFAIPMAICL